MPTNLLAPNDTSSDQQPVNLLASDSPESGAKVSDPKVPTATTYVPEKGLSIDHPADMSHDQVNDAIQTQIFDRPRNLSFKFDPMSIALGAGEDAGLKETKLVPETAKAAVRMAESIPKGIGALMGVMGEAGLEGVHNPDGFAAMVDRGFRDMGNNAYEFYKDRGEKGWEAPDPEIFRGSFMSNPSVTRLAADIIQNVPLVAATAVASASTGGAAPIALFGAMAAGEAGKAAEENGSTAQKALAVGAGAGVGNAVLMSLPIGKYIAKLGLPAAVTESATFATLGAAMTPFNNLVAKIGGDRTRKLSDGFTESLLSMAASGLVLGAFHPGHAAEHDADVQAATKAGVTPKEIDAARAALAKQIVENPDAVTASMLEKMQQVEFNFGANVEKKADGGAETVAGVIESDKKNKELSGEDAGRKREIEEAQRTVASYEANNDFITEVGRFRRPANDQLKEELSSVSKAFFTNETSAEALDEVADRLGMTTNELIDRLQDVSKVSRQAAKASYKDAQKLILDAENEAILQAYEQLRKDKEAGREYVKNEPILLQKAGKDKTTGDLLRKSVSETRDVQRARGYQFAEELSRLLPDKEDQRGLFWHRAAEGDQEWLKEAAASEDMADYKDGIERAINPSEKFLEAAGKLDKFYKEWGEVGQEIGVLPEELRQAYQAGWYVPEKAMDFVKTEGSGGLKRLSSEHGQHKIYDSPFEAVQSGKTLATDNAVEAMKKYNLDMATVATNRKLADAMTGSGLAAWVRPRKIAEGWEQVGTIGREIPLKDANGEIIKDDQGNQAYSSMILTAPKGIAKALEASTDPNYLAKIEAVRALQKYQQIVKMADVSLGFFHDFNEAKASFYSRGLQDLTELKNLQKHFETANWKERELHLISNGGTTIASHPNTDIIQSLREAFPEPEDSTVINKISDIADKAAELPVVDKAAKVIDKAAELTETHANFLFNEAMRYLKVQDYWSQVSDWAAKNSEATNEEAKTAARGIAEHVNAKYGGLNWEALGFSKTHVALLRLGEFAPDWTQAKIEMVKQSFGKGAAAGASRKYLATSLAVGMLITEGLNKLLTGHFTDENEKGHFMEVEIAPGVHISALPGVVEDLANLSSRILTGGAEGAFAWAEGKVSPVGRLFAMMLSRSLYSGAPIVQRSHRGEPFSMTYDWTKAILAEAAPVPFAVSSIWRYLSADQQKTLPGVLATASGVGRFSEQHKAKEESFA